MASERTNEMKSYEEKKKCISDVVNSMYGKQMKGQKAKDHRGTLIANISNPDNKSAIVQVGLFRKLPKELASILTEKGKYHDAEFRKKIAQFLLDHEGYVEGSHYCYISSAGKHVIRYILGQTKDDYEYDARQMKYLFDPKKIFSQQERDIYIQYIKVLANK